MRGNTGMDELRESSLLFSLEGLLETERERVQREQRELLERRENELRRTAEVAERRRQAEQQRREAEARRQALADERARLEQAQIDAVKQATIERARLEVEARVKLAEIEQRSQHELSLSRIREAQRGARYRAWSWLSSVGLLLVAVGSLALYAGFIVPRHAHELAHLQSLLSASTIKSELVEQKLGAERRQSEKLSERVHALEARPPEAQPDPKTSPPTVRPEPKRTPRTPTAPADCADDGDPLSPCLRHRR